MEWSIIVFVLVAGLTALLWAYVTGADRRLLAYETQRIERAHGIGIGEAPTPVVEPKPVAAPEVPRHPLDGMPMDEGGDRQVFGISIDNHVDARPQSGVSKARLVYEAPVEGGITRLLAFFTDADKIDEIGPVRSARPYFNDWVREFGAAYGHVGGSPEALDLIETTGIRDMNQYFFGAYYWRDSGRYAPHNVYTSTALLSRALTRAGKGEAPDKALLGRFSASLAEGRGRPVSGVAIDFSSPAFETEWRYDAESGTWSRRQGGKAIADADGSPVRARNVVVQFTTVTVVDAVGRRHIVTSGKGDAFVLRDGRVIDAQWSRAREGVTAYTDTDGEPVPLAPGTTWIEVVPEGTDVSFTER